jgi:predicted ester cyclase
LATEPASILRRTSGPPDDREGVKIVFQAFWSAFPDFQVEIHDMIAEGGFMGIPPTGTRVAFDVIDIVRCENGQLVEHWNVVDQLDLMRQLGVVST